MLVIHEGMVLWNLIMARGRLPHPTPPIPWYLEAISSQPHDTHDEDPKPLCPKEAMKWMGVRNIKTEYSLSEGPMRGNMGLGFGPNPIRFPWTAALDILQTLLKSCPTRAPYWMDDDDVWIGYTFSLCTNHLHASNSLVAPKWHTYFLY